MVLAVKGSGSGKVVGEAYAVTEETAVFATTTEIPVNQLIDLNTVSQGIGGAASTVQAPRTLAVYEQYVMPRTAVLTTLAEDEEERTGITEYEVQPGDVLGGIAFDFGVSMQTIISANKITNVDALKPGTKLKIPPVSGVIVTVKAGDTVSSLAKKYSGEQEKIITFNGLPLAGELQIGDELVIPDGKMPVAAPTKAITRTAVFAGLPKYEGYFINPASCVITQKGHGRNGVDCAAKTGTPIYAAASGKVNLADPDGYNGGFGKYVRVSHANGAETLYAHMSKMVVVSGETVSQGQLLGYIGNTGRSTGPHLHYEVHSSYNNLGDYKKGASVIAKQ